MDYSNLINEEDKKLINKEIDKLINQLINEEKNLDIFDKTCNAMRIIGNQENSKLKNLNVRELTFFEKLKYGYIFFMKNQENIIIENFEKISLKYIKDNNTKELFKNIKELLFLYEKFSSNVNHKNLEFLNERAKVWDEKKLNFEKNLITLYLIN